MNKMLLKPSEYDVSRPASLDEIVELRRDTKNPIFAKKCDEFLAAVAAGDEITEFCTSRRSWNIGFGRAGYQLHRSGLVRLELLVRMN
jgi:hypothetical protein